MTAEQRPRAAFIGSVAFSERLLARLAVCESITVAGVATLRAAPSHADFQSLAPTAAQAGLACLELDGNDQERLADWLHGLAVDVAFCIGWPHLLREAVLETPRLGVIGYHPTLLPANRGRHPIIWALALGLDSTGSTFFVMDRGADSGDIVSQREVTIGDATMPAASMRDSARWRSRRSTRFAANSPPAVCRARLRTRRGPTRGAGGHDAMASSTGECLPLGSAIWSAR